MQTSHRKVLIATPIKLGLDSNYMRWLVPVLQRRWENVEIEHALLEGPSVNFARNECVQHARDIGAGEILFVDDDMGPTMEQTERMLSHADLDVVAGPYCKRKPGKPAWLLNPKPGAVADPVSGLIEVNDIATGFMKIRLDTVCPALEAKYPHLEHVVTRGGRPETTWEFFPMGCEGPRTPQARLDRIKAIISKYDNDHIFEPYMALQDIEEACYDDQPPGVLRGEDYFFCHMVRECGLKVFADLGMPPIAHFGLVPHPITPEMVGLS